MKMSSKLEWMCLCLSVIVCVSGGLLRPDRRNKDDVYILHQIPQDIHKPSVELRGLWLATASNIDWPPVGEYNTTVQKLELIDYLDSMSDTNMNTVFFHVRPKGDAFYNSTLEPWSAMLAGTQGIPPDPYYDPLEFLMDEAAKRSIEVHAWLNPYIANSPATFDGLAPDHVAMRYPQYAYQYGNFLWMDPGAPEIADNLLAVIMDIITRYQVNGIHFDDFFYPYPEQGEVFKDNATYTEYLESGGTMSLADWRRDNVNRLINKVYNEIKAYDSEIKFTVSPFGLYRPGEPDGMPAPIEGLDPYSEIFADSKLWLQQGWVDALIPQIYWKIDPPEQSYPVILDWWLSVNNASRDIYAGNAAYKLLPEQENWNVSELINQVNISRLPENRDRFSLGNVWFSAKYFIDDYKNVSTIFKETIYSTPIPPPVIP